MTIMLFILIIIVILTTIHFVQVFLRNYFRAVLLAFKLKGPPSLPLIGNCHLINQSKELVNIGNNIDKYGPIVRIWISILPAFIVYEPRHLKVILSSNKLSQKADYYRFLHNFLGNGLVTSDGDKWKQNRRIVQSMFGANVLQIFLNYFKEMSAEFCNTIINGNEGDVKVSNLINTFVLQVTLKTVLGIKESNIKTPFRKCGHSLQYRLLRPWFLFESFFKFTSIAEKEKQQKVCANQFIENILASRLANKTSSATTVCFLNMLIELAQNNEPHFSYDEIIKEIRTLILAGQDTVATTISFALYHLAVHKDIQDRVFQELESIADADNISLEQLNELVFLDQCIKETLRLTPAIPMFGRKLQKDIQLDQYTIPAGTNIFISPFCTQRLGNFYHNPQQFDPDRYNSSKLLHPFAYLPFSLGHRNCIGSKYAMLEMKTFIVTILKAFQLELCEAHENVELMYTLTLRAKGGIWIRFKKRHL